MRFWRGFIWGAGTVAGLGVLGAVTLARPLRRQLMGGTMGRVTGAPFEPRTILIWHDGKHQDKFEGEEGALYALTPEIAAITGVPLAWTDDEAPEMAGVQPDPWYFQRRRPLSQQPGDFVH